MSVCCWLLVGWLVVELAVSYASGLVVSRSRSQPNQPMNNYDNDDDDDGGDYDDDGGGDRDGDDDGYDCCDDDDDDDDSRPQTDALCVLCVCV
jgi:hypothetical protein